MIGMRSFVALGGAAARLGPDPGGRAAADAGADHPLAGREGPDRPPGRRSEAPQAHVAALGSLGTVEAVDLDAGRVSPPHRGAEGAAGAGLPGGPDQLAAASGEDGRSASRGRKPEARRRADRRRRRRQPAGLRTGMLVVGHGGGALSVVDPRSRTVIASVVARPSGRVPARGARALVNLPGAGPHRRRGPGGRPGDRRVEGRHGFNSPLALDAAAGASPASTGCRRGWWSWRPRRARRKPTSLPAATRTTPSSIRRVGAYVVCGAGQIDVVVRVAPGAMPVSLGRVATRSSARTGLFVPDLDRLYVAARAGAGEEAAILVFRPWTARALEAGATGP